MVRVLIRTAIAAVLIIFCTAVHAETDTETVKGPEMMADAIAKLEAIYDLPITYDELIIPYQEKELPTVKFPDGLSFTYEPVPADISMEDRKQLAAKKIKEVLDRYSSAYGKEMYVMHEGNGGFHVVQIRYANKSGEVVSYTPILDTPISMEEKTRSPEEAVSKICEEVAKASGQEIRFLPCGAGACGNGWYSRTETNIGASNEPARDVLDRLLAQLPINAEKEVCPNHGCFKDVPGHLSWRVRWSGMLYPHVIAPPGMVGGQNTMDKPFLNAPERTLTVEGERPIVKAIDQLEEIYGIPINYEDPPSFPSMETVVDKNGRKLKLDSVSFDYNVPLPNATLENRKTLAGKALANLIYYIHRHSMQDFTLYYYGNNFLELVPQWLGVNGQTVQERTFSETRLSLPPEARSMTRLLKEICQGVSKEDRALYIGKVPEDLLKNDQDLGIRDEPAGPVLGGLAPPLSSWRILCNPKDNKDCSLNLHTMAPKAN